MQSLRKLPQLAARPTLPAHLLGKQHLMAAGADCLHCPLAKHRFVRSERGSGAPPSLALVGEAPGKREVQTGRPFCLVPETLVLMADLTWKPLGEIVVGDEIMTVEENARANGLGVSGHSARHWTIAKVTNTHRAMRTTRVVTTPDGELIGTPDHRVLVRYGKSGTKRWKQIDQLRPRSKTGRFGSRIAFAVRPWVRDESYEAGWLGGFYDGEGFVSGSRSERAKKGSTVGFAQNLGPTRDRAHRYLKKLGFSLRVSEEQREKGIVCARDHLRGGFAENARLLGTVRPERLIADFKRTVHRHSVNGIGASQVRTIHDGGLREVIDITTTAGTFIANGFVVHNCGKSGELLNYALHQATIARPELAILNAIACGPIPSDNEIVKHAAMRACRPRLLTELRTLKPKGILAIGAKALAALAPAGSSGVTALRGALLPLADDVATDDWKPSFTSTFHPAHIMRGGDGDNDNPDGESDASVDLLYFFFLFDLAKAHRFASGQAKAWQDNCDLFLTVGPDLYRATVDDDGNPAIGAAATEAELLNALRRVIEEARDAELSCDVETDGRDSLEANLTAIAYATPTGGVSATWSAWQMFPAIAAELRALHADKSVRWNWQNGIYDRCVFKRHGLAIVGPSEDTLLKHHGAFPGLPHRLDQIATQFFITPPWKNEFRTSVKDEAALVLYNYRDAHSTARISVALNQHLKTARTERVYEADRQINVIATRMRQVGMYVDRAEQARHRAVQTARLEYMKAALAQDFASIEEEWRQTLARLLADRQRKKDPDNYLERVAMRYEEIAEREKKATDVGFFKPKAKADIVALFQVLRIPFTDYTPKGAPVTDKKAMETAAARHPLMRRLNHVREAQHLIATYIELPVKRDGRMHPDWKTTKITGRWGAGKSQNVPNNAGGWPPKTNPDGSFKTTPNGSLITPRENLRSIIAAPTANQILEIEHNVPGSVDRWVLMRAKRGFGRKLVGADMDQVELRILAFLSKDPFLLAIFNEGRDPHSEFSVFVFPKHFPKLVEEIKAAGWKPKALGAAEDEYVRLKALTDDVSRARAAKLERIVLAMKEWKQLRDFTKRVEYGGAYRGKARTIHEALVKVMPDVELSAVEHGIEVFYERAAMVPRWHNDQDTKCRLYRESREALLGRVRLFPLGNFSPTVAVNFPIQAYGASLMTLAFFRFTAMTQPQILEFDRLYRFGLLDAKWVKEMKAKGFNRWKAPVELLSNGHDSILAECDEEDADRAAELLQLSMTQTVQDPDGSMMTYSAEAHVSQRWSRA